MTSSTGPPLPNDTSLGHLSTTSAAHNHDSPDWSAIIHGLQQETRSHPGCPLVTHGLYSAVPTKHTPTNLAVYIPTPSTTHTIAVESQTHTPPTEGDDGTGTPQPHAGRSMVAPSQASVSNSAFHLTRSEPIAPPTPESPESQSGATHTKGGPDSGTGERLGLGISSQSQADSTVKWPASSLDDEPQDEDSENIEAVLLNGLVPDCQVESNAIPYIVHCFASTVIRFTFEPTRIIPALQGYISHAHSFGYETRQNLLLISNILLAVSKSTDYDLTDFTTLQNQMVRRVVDARAQAELTRDSALVAMEHNHERQFISTLWRVGSLANVMSIMDLYAPVFRRACPEPGDELVNLPRRLTIPGMNLKYYVILDVLQSFITHRPMFFRYDLEYLSPEEEALVKSDYGPGLRWLYGVPDQLMITLARMNTLFEVHGNRVDPATVLGLEGEIEDCALVVDTSPGIDPTLNIGRATVQQSWKMAATIYLYMASQITQFP
ncbi:hypothetical protein FRC11_003644 [Ceratobasidium sp. 423]|nr:hypothetical protein FRC11_003644 [Ceratobasidium sp. 423]